MNNAYPHGGRDPEQVFESETDRPNGLMAAWELGEQRGELRYLRRADGDPQPSPWHAKVIGPDPLAGGRVESIWSMTHSDRETAVQKLMRQLRRKHRNSEHERAAVADDGSLGYAVLDPEYGGFARSGFYGKEVYESHDAARAAATGRQRVVKLVPVDGEQ